MAMSDTKNYRDPDELLTDKEAAELTKLSVRTFQAWRMSGKGPEYIRISSRAVRYRRETLLKFFQSLARQSTSDDRRAG